MANRVEHGERVSIAKRRHKPYVVGRFERDHRVDVGHRITAGRISTRSAGRPRDEPDLTPIRRNGASNVSSGVNGYMSPAPQDSELVNDLRTHVYP